MTSNQLAYWRDQETKRANAANENLKSQANAIEKSRVQETKRHNLTDEEIRKVQNALEEKNIHIKDKSLLNDLYRTMASSESWDLSAVPSGLKNRIMEEFGTELLFSDQTTSNMSYGLKQLGETFRNIFGTFGQVAKGVGSLLF